MTVPNPLAAVRSFAATAAEAIGLGAIPDPAAPEPAATVVPPITAALKDARRDLDTDPCDRRLFDLHL